MGYRAPSGPFLGKLFTRSQNRSDDVSEQTNHISDKFEARFDQRFDEFCIELIICIPGAPRQRYGRFDTFQHKDLARRILKLHVTLMFMNVERKPT